MPQPEVNHGALFLSPILSTVVSKVILPCTTVISLTALLFSQHKLSLARNQVDNLTQVVRTGNRNAEQLNTQIQILNAEIRRLNVDIGNKDAVINSLTQKIQNLNEDFHQIYDTLVVSIDENEALSNRIRELEIELNNSNASCEQAIQEKFKLERQIVELKADILRCQADKEQTVHELEENIQHLTQQLKDQQNLSAEQINSLQETIARYEAEISNIRRKSSSDTEKLKHNKQKLKQLQSQIHQLQKDKDQEIEQLQIRIEEKDEELQNIRQEFEDRLTVLKEKLKNREKEVTDKNKQLRDIQIQLKDAESNFSIKDAKIQELQRQITNINKIVDERNENINTLEQRIRQLSADISSRDTELGDSRERIRELLDQIRVLNEKIDQLSKLPDAPDIGLTQTIIALAPPKFESPSVSASDIYVPLVSDDTKTVDATSDDFYYKSRKLTMIDKSTEEIFPAEPRIVDINQGGLGDCYYLTAIGCMVHRHPNFIKSMIKDNGDGTVTVRFYDRTNSERFYKIKKSIPSKNIQCQNCLWIQLLEKAYVAFKSEQKSKNYDYDNIDGGLSHKALRDITGKSSTEHGLISWKSSGSHYIPEDKYDGRKLGVYSREALSFLNELEAREQTQLLAVSEGERSVPGHIIKGIYDHHAYAILKIERDVETRTGKKLNLITLRNPHGRTIPQYILDAISGKYDIDKAPIDNNGIFKMDLNDFLKYFSRFQFCEL